jgi:MFS transporter, DHA1 family, multidrug resistance protein
LSPALSSNGLHLALAAGAFSLVAYGLWLWYLAHCDKLPDACKDA